MDEDIEEEDMEKVISNIQQMRNEMLEYVQKDGDQSLLDNIKNIIDPENFIEKHNIE